MANYTTLVIQMVKFCKKMRRAVETSAYAQITMQVLKPQGFPKIKIIFKNK